jgi:N-acetylmuramoyl-L-alanine amidase
MLLWHQVEVQNTSGATSPFYSKSIKNRIIMITKNKTSKRFYILYLLMVPVFCALLFAFSKRPGVSAAHAVASEGVVIVVDPGHGGSDPGSRSSSGPTEKQLTLSIARLIQSVGNNKGLKVVLTRAEDESITLQERTSVSEKHDAKLFLSIHINSHSDVSKSGIVCMVSESNVDFEQSRKFSGTVMGELGLVKGISVNGIVESDFYVLKNNAVPAIALELGYLSNEADKRFIGEEANQKVIAERIVAAILKHLK